MVVWLNGELVWLYSCTFERDPNECNVLIELRFREIRFTASINHTAYTTAPILQKCGFEQHVSNGWVLRERMVRLLDGFNRQLIW